MLVVAPHVRDTHAGGELAPYEIVRELGSRPLPVLLGRHPLSGGKSQLVVLERVTGAGRADEKSAEIVKAARRIAAIANPNVARVREVAIRGDDLLVVGDYIDGVKLAELWRLDSEPMPLEVVLRVLIDTLNGLGALHNVRDAKQQPMKLAHGEVAPTTILCAIDGTARLLNAITRSVPGARAESGSSPYVAPEVEAGEPFDARADVFGVGVLLWEALAGKPIAAAGSRPNPVPPAGVPAKAPWAKGLVDVAAKALAQSPDGRWATAAAMAAEIRKAAGLKLAPTSAVAAWLGKTVGETVRARRAAAEGPAAPMVVASPTPAPVVAAAPVALPPAAAPPPPTPVAAPPQPEVEEGPPSSDAKPRSVTVAPGIEAPVSDVIELSPESAELALESVRPPPAPEARTAPPLPRAPAAPPPGGVLIDPFAAKDAPSPPSPAITPAPKPAAPPASEAEKPQAKPAPAVALPEEEKPPVSGAPLYASAMDSPPSIALPDKPVREPMQTVPSMVRQFQAETRTRNKRVVLASVGVLGLAFCALLAYRRYLAPIDVEHTVEQTTTAARPPQHPPSPSGAAAQPPAANASTPAPASAALAAQSAPSSVADSPAASASAPAASAASSAVAATPPWLRGKPGSAKGTAATPPSRPKWPVVSSGGVRPKPKPKPFDPNSL